MDTQDTHTDRTFFYEVDSFDEEKTKFQTNYKKNLNETICIYDIFYSILKLNNIRNNMKIFHEVIFNYVQQKFRRWAAIPEKLTGRSRVVNLVVPTMAAFQKNRDAPLLTEERVRRIRDPVHPDPCSLALMATCRYPAKL